MIAAVREALTNALPACTVCLSTVDAQASQANLQNQLALLERELGMGDLPTALSGPITLETVLRGLLARTCLGKCLWVASSLPDRQTGSG